MPPALKPVWEKIVGRYVDGLKLGVSEIVSNGYDSTAKKYSCEGKISLTTATSDSAQVRTAYTSQAGAKGNGEFLVTVDRAGAIAAAVLDDFVQFAQSEALRENQKSAQEASPDPDSAPSAPDVHQEAPVVAAEPARQPEPPPVSDPAPAASPTATAAPPELKLAAPSFDCAKASTRAEHLICDTPQIGDADAKLAALYRDAMSRVADKHALRSSQATWRKTVRDACDNAACMVDAYQRRITQLGELK